MKRCSMMILCLESNTSHKGSLVAKTWFEILTEEHFNSSYCISHLPMITEDIFCTFSFSGGAEKHVEVVGQQEQEMKQKEMEERGL